jgi:hypothetical protein
MLLYYAGVRIPLFNTFRTFDILALAYVALLVGVLFRGL